MNELKKKAISFAAAGLMLVNLAVPAIAATYEISGNNTDSQSLIDVDFDRDVNLKQKNEADVKNKISIEANSGDNEAENISNGNVEIDTGAVEVGVKVENQLNSNFASIDLCNGCAFEGDFKIAGNNTDTDNTIEFESETELDVEQENEADVENDIEVLGNSGGNEVESVVGGDVAIDTGSVTIEPIWVKNTLNANWLSVFSGEGEGEGVSAWIVDNNTGSDNLIDLDFEQDLDVEQENEADVENDVDVEGTSGENEAEDIANGSVGIDTGAVEIGVLLDTMANFNLADIAECCLLSDLSVKIAGNNTDTDNTIELELEDELDLEQENEFECDKKNCNDIEILGMSGDNEVEDSVAEGEDPEVDTGPVDVAVEVTNSANVNTFGDVDFDFPDGTGVDINLDFGGLLEALQDLIGLLGGE